MKTKTVNRYNVPSDWKVDNLGNITNNFDSKRVLFQQWKDLKRRSISLLWSSKNYRLH